MTTTFKCPDNQIINQFNFRSGADIDNITAYCTDGTQLGQLGGIGGDEQSPLKGMWNKIFQTISPDNILKSINISGTQNHSVMGKEFGIPLPSGTGTNLPLECPDGQFINGYSGNTVNLNGSTRVSPLNFTCGPPPANNTANFTCPNGHVIKTYNISTDGNIIKNLKGTCTDGTELPKIGGPNGGNMSEIYQMVNKYEVNTSSLDQAGLKYLKLGNEVYGNSVFPSTVFSAEGYFNNFVNGYIGIPYSDKNVNLGYAELSTGKYIPPEFINQNQPELDKVKFKSYVCPNGTTLDNLNIMSGGLVDAVEGVCSDGTKLQKLGGAGGGPASLKVNNRIKYYINNNDNLIHQISDNDNNYGEILQDQSLYGQSVDFNCPEGKKLVGYQGITGINPSNGFVGVKNFHPICADLSSSDNKMFEGVSLYNIKNGEGNISNTTNTNNIQTEYNHSNGEYIGNKFVPNTYNNPVGDEIKNVENNIGNIMFILFLVIFLITLIVVVISYLGESKNTNNQTK
jgi:hypothetical protein